MGISLQVSEVPIIEKKPVCGKSIVTMNIETIVIAIPPIAKSIGMKKCERPILIQISVKVYQIVELRAI